MWCLSIEIKRERPKTKNNTITMQHGVLFEKNPNKVGLVVFNKITNRSIDWKLWDNTKMEQLSSSMKPQTEALFHSFCLVPCIDDAKSQV